MTQGLVWEFIPRTDKLNEGVSLMSLSLFKPVNALCFRNPLLSTWAFQTASSAGKLTETHPILLYFFHPVLESVGNDKYQIDTGSGYVFTRIL